MAVNLSPIWGAGAQLLDNSGNVLSGGKIYTYAAGTTTQVATYTSNTGGTANSNPIILNSAGRVPYEIWLTDGQNYKFVLKDSNNVLIGTWDNLSGINSNFIAYTNQQEIQTATAGQTVFNLTTMNYLPGTNSLSVFVDGVNQYGPSAQYAYTETDSNTVTFASGLHVGAEVKFTSSQIQNAGAVDASQVSYTYPSTGGITQSVETKLSQYINLLDFGADGTGDSTFDNTPALNDAIQAAINTYHKTIYISGGVYYFNTKPANITNSVKIVGDGKSSTVLKRNFSPSNSFDGLFNLRDGAGGCILQDFTIQDTASTTGGCQISMYKAVANATGAGDFSELRGLNLTTDGTNTHGYAIYIDGTARTGTTALGVRDVWISDCSIFGGQYGAIYAHVVRGFHVANTDTFQAGGSSGVIEIGGAVGKESYSVEISGIGVDGINLTNTIVASINVANCGLIANDSTAQYVTFIGNCSSGIQRNVLRSHYVNSAYPAQFADLQVTYGGYGAPSGTSNPYVFQITPAAAGAVYLDALNGSSSGAYTVFRNYNNTAYNTTISTASTGGVSFPSIGTTAAAANAYLDGSNNLIKATSSLIYKTDIEDLQGQYANKVLDFRPVWYRSVASADRKDWSWYGLIAEEVAQIEPRLVHWKYDKYETNAQNEQIPSVDAKLVADGIQYDRLAVLLLKVIQEQEKRIAKLEGKQNA